MAAFVAAAAAAPRLHGQDVCPRILEQDPTLDNLVDPPGYATAKLGTLGGVVRAGTGAQAMILIPGLGFSANIFRELMDGLAEDCRMVAVTLPGFGGTPAPPCPPEKTSFGEQTWTQSALNAIEKLIEDEGLVHPVVVGHWLTGTQLALRLAMKHPDSVKGVLILSGSARMFSTDPAQAQYFTTLERRVQAIDTYMAPRWFKTVTRETWDDNNFRPGDYAANPVRGLRLWREAAAPRLHVWVRYLCEFNASDICFEKEKLTVPTLLLQPGLEGDPMEPGSNYMQGYLRDSWSGCLGDNPLVTVKTIPNSRVCLWFDQPQAVHDAVVGFLKSLD